MSKALPTMFVQNKPNPLKDLDTDVREVSVDDVLAADDPKEPEKTEPITTVQQATNIVVELEGKMKVVINAAFPNKQQRLAVLQLVQREFDFAFEKLG